MKVSRQLARIEPMILHPIREVRGDVWHRAPEGKWSLAQIVSHLAISLDSTAGVFERRADRTDLRRRASPRQQLLRHLALGMGTLPSPRKVPAATHPEPRPDPDLATAHFRMALRRFETMIDGWTPDQQGGVFVAHPALGDLTLPEWVRFFYLYSRFAAHRIHVRLRWLRRG